MLKEMDKSLTVPSFMMTVVDTEDDTMDPEGMIIGPKTKLDPDTHRRQKISATESETTIGSKYRLSMMSVCLKLIIKSSCRPGWKK